MTGEHGADAVVAVCGCALVGVDLWRLAAAWRSRRRAATPPFAQRFADAMVADLMDDIDTLYGTTTEPARTDV